jgi:bacterioferritin
MDAPTRGAARARKNNSSDMTLDEGALDKARTHLDDGAVTPSIGPWSEQIVALLNDALATELVCILRYKRHHFTARGMASPAIAAEFMVHATEETGHADKIAERIRANLVAERVAVEAYRQMIGLIGDKDPTTRRMLETILADEEEHADEMNDLLEKQ